MSSEISTQGQYKGGPWPKGYKVPGASRFQPGQSGNPGGMPKGTPSIARAYHEILSLSDAELKAFKPANQAEKIALRRIKDAARALTQGIAPAIIKATEIITDRTDGPVEKRHVIEDATANVAAQAVKDFVFYSEQNRLFVESLERHGLHQVAVENIMTRERLTEIVVGSFKPAEQAVALQAIEDAWVDG